MSRMTSPLAPAHWRQVVQWPRPSWKGLAFISLKTCQQSFCPWNVGGWRLLGTIPSSGRCKGLVAGTELKGGLACPTPSPQHGSPGSSAGKECLKCMRPWFDSWVGKIPRRRDRLPTPVFLGFPGGSGGKESSHNVGDPVWSLGWEDPLEKEKATHSNILAWRIPWTTVSVEFSLVSQLCLTFCDPMNWSTPGLPVHHQLLKFTQTHVHQVGDAI